MNIKKRIDGWVKIKNFDWYYMLVSLLGWLVVFAVFGLDHGIVVTPSSVVYVLLLVLEILWVIVSLYIIHKSS